MSTSTSSLSPKRFLLGALALSGATSTHIEPQGSDILTTQFAPSTTDVTSSFLPTETAAVLPTDGSSRGILAKRAKNRYITITITLPGDCSTHTARDIGATDSAKKEDEPVHVLEERAKRIKTRTVTFNPCVSTIAAASQTGAAARAVPFGIFQF